MDDYSAKCGMKVIKITPSFASCATNRSGEIIAFDVFDCVLGQNLRQSHACPCCLNSAKHAHNLNLIDQAFLEGQIDGLKADLAYLWLMRRAELRQAKGGAGR
jgi:hypothetical protein